MSHLLDNPAWAALTTGNQNLSNGSHTAKFFSEKVSPFAAISEPDQSLQELYDVVPFKNPIGIFTNRNSINPYPWKLINKIYGYQLLYSKDAELPVINNTIVKLNEHHVAEMLELTRITNPGPFLPETISFGNYEGILVEGKLVAMAGHRFHCHNYVEISAVCTHPDYLGCGYARDLLNSQIDMIQRRGEIPYLHVRADNKRALEIYLSMGFKIRSEMIIYILSKE